MMDLKMHQNNDFTTVRKTCYACDDVIEQDSFYVAGNDEFGKERMMHKFCVALPLKMMRHPGHPDHPLTLMPFRSQSCDFCNRRSSDRLMYTCLGCNFNIDSICGSDATLKLLSSKSKEERAKMALKDLSHPHPLRLLHIQSHHQDDEDDDGKDANIVIQHCQACQQPIIDSSYYSCAEESEGCVTYFLHKFCAELPVEMKHALHPLHPLMLMVSPPLEHFRCFACGKFCKAHTYSCRRCSFQLDIICATAMSRVLEHKCHQHPLTILPRPSKSFCNACCKFQEGIFYHCNTCVVFFIHEDCASLPYAIDHESHQGHPLRLGYRSDGSHERKECDICDQKIYDGSGWFYYCWECKFYAHLNCITSGNNRGVQEIDPEIPRLAWEESNNVFGTVGLLTRKLRSIQMDEKIEMDTINHYGHPQHPLILKHDVPTEANPYSKGEITITIQCNGCCKQISAPFYSCVDCQFYIHKGCALLPRSIAQHHAHPEHDKCKLVLLREPWFETRVFLCGDCKRYSNGFSYQCEEEFCKYQVDLECAFLPSQIVHKAHPFHILHKKLHGSFFQDKRFKCCSRTYNPSKTSSYVYKCDTCNFKIHLRCAIFPAKAEHRFDTDNPFMLTFNPAKIEPNAHHYCDLCEYQLDPKKWYYSSKMRGPIMHPDCLLHRDRPGVANPNFKSISSLIIFDIHPHPLHLYPTNPFTKCDHCKMEMQHHDILTTNVQLPFQFAYICVEWNCPYEIHVRCASQFIWYTKDGTQETYGN